MIPRHPATPPIDVVIPVYNGASFIRQALDSVNKQTLQPQTVIVVDDGSTDDTAKIIQEYASVIPLQYLRQENRGLSSARNAGWKASQAPFIAFLDADDVWEPEKLAEQSSILTSAPDNLLLVYCGYHHINLEGQRVINNTLPIVQPALRGNVFQELLRLNLISGSGSAVVVRREALVKLGGFDESLRALEDWDMWLRLTQIGRLDFVDRDLVGIRTHHAGMQQDTDRMLIGTLSFYSRWLERLPSEIDPPRFWVKRIAYYAATVWPPLRLHRLVHRHLSAVARRRLSRFILRQMKLYTVFRMFSLPFEWLRRRPWNNQTV